MGNSLFNFFRIYGTTVAQSNTVLFLEERNVAHIGSFFVLPWNIIQQTFYQLTAF